MAQRFGHLAVGDPALADVEPVAQVRVPGKGALPSELRELHRERERRVLSFIAWCVLLVLCWPLALLLWPVVWLLSLPARVRGGRPKA